MDRSQQLFIRREIRSRHVARLAQNIEVLRAAGLVARTNVELPKPPPPPFKVAVAEPHRQCQPGRDFGSAVLASSSTARHSLLCHV